MSTEWSLWARPDLALHGKRLVFPRTDLSQFPRDTFPHADDVRVAAESVNIREQPYTFRGWIWIGRSTESRPPDYDPSKPGLVGVPARLDGPAISSFVLLRDILSPPDPRLLQRIAKKAVSTLVEAGVSR